MCRRLCEASLSPALWLHSCLRSLPSSIGVRPTWSQISIAVSLSVADDRHYVMISRLATVLLVIASALVSVLLADIRSGWQVVLEVGAGTGGVYLSRWYWWRINAWSEISAMATALVMTVSLRWAAPFSGTSTVVFAKTALTTTAVTTLG